MPSETVAQPETSLTGGPRNAGEELCHIVALDEPDRALCGKDVTGYPWNPPWPMCVVCVGLVPKRPGYLADGPPGAGRREAGT